MKSIYHFLLTLIFAIIISIVSCKKGGKCEAAFNVNQSEVVVAFKDQTTGKYLYSEVSPLYDKDSLKVLDENGNSLILLSALNQIPNTSSRYWDISFGSLYNQSTDASSFDAEICKVYTIRYRYNEIDTIKVCYKSRATECGSVFETLKVYYQEQLIGMETNTTGILVTVIKN